MTTCINQKPFSSVIETAITEYKTHIRPLTKQYVQIDATKAEWTARTQSYTQGKFPATEDVLQQTLKADLDRFSSLQTATAKINNLYKLFQSTIETITTSSIRSQDYAKLQNLGYDIKPAQNGEKALPLISKELTALLERIDTIKSHMNVRLPKAENSLNGLFKAISDQRGESTWTQAIRGSVENIYLKNALDIHQKPKGKDAGEINQMNSALNKASIVDCSKKTNPDEEAEKLQRLLTELQRLSKQDSFVREDNSSKEIEADWEFKSNPEAATPGKSRELHTKIDAKLHTTTTTAGKKKT